MNFKIDWGSLISDIVKKKDLDCYEFANCWDEGYNWNQLDNFVICNYEDLLIGYGEVEKERIGMRVNLKKDLDKYFKKINDLKVEE